MTRLKKSATTAHTHPSPFAFKGAYWKLSVTLGFLGHEPPVSLYESVMNLSLFQTLMFSIDGLHCASGTWACDFGNSCSLRKYPIKWLLFAPYHGKLLMYADLFCSFFKLIQPANYVSRVASHPARWHIKRRRHLIHSCCYTKMCYQWFYFSRPQIQKGSGYRQSPFTHKSCGCIEKNWGKVFFSL